MQHIFVGCLLGISFSVGAQPVAFESVRLAETLVESGWSVVEQTLPPLVTGFESQLKANGVSERGSRIFGEELHRSMSKDNFSKAYAVAISAKFTPEEISEANAFLRGKSGQKFLSLSKEFASNPALVQPIVKQACSGAIQRLETGTDASNLRSLCGRL